MAELPFDGDYIRSKYGDDPVVVRFLDAVIALRAALAAAQEEARVLRELLNDARASLRFARSWSRYIDLQGVLTTTPLKDDFWSWAEGWDCDLELRIDAALATPPAPQHK